MKTMQGLSHKTLDVVMKSNNEQRVIVPFIVRHAAERDNLY